MTVLSIFFYILFSYFYYVDMAKLKNAFILKLPYYILILDIWASISGYLGVNAGINGISSFFLISFLIYYIIYYNRRIATIGYFLLFTIGLFLIYIFFRVNFNNDIESMVTRYSSYLVLFMLVPITYAEVNHLKDFDSFILTIRKILLTYLVATIIFSAFKFGKNMYETGIIYGLAERQLNSIAFLVSILFFIAITLKSKVSVKTKDIFLCLCVVIILCLTLRRTYLIIMITTFGILIIPHILKPKYIILSLLGLLCILGLYSIIGDKRDKLFTMDTEEENRFVEYRLVQDIMSRDLNFKLFGDGELFVTRGKYDLKNDDRPLHTGHTELLLGAGVIGLSLFILLMASIFIKMLKTSWLSKNKFNSKLYTLSIAFPAIYAILSFSGGIRSPSSMIIMITFIVCTKYIVFNGEYRKRTNSYYYPSI